MREKKGRSSGLSHLNSCCVKLYRRNIINVYGVREKESITYYYVIANYPSLGIICYHTLTGKTFYWYKTTRNTY